MRYTKNHLILLLVVLGFVSAVTGETPDRRILVPYGDLATLVSPADKAILMDADKFNELLAAADQSVFGNHHADFQWPVHGATAGLASRSGRSPRSRHRARRGESSFQPRRSRPELGRGTCRKPVIDGRAA